MECTKDCVLYEHKSCHLNTHKEKAKWKHRKVCNSPTPGSYKEKEFDIYTMLDDSEYHPEPKKKRAAKLNMHKIAVGKNRVPRPPKGGKVFARPVMQMTKLEGKTLNTYPSVSAAATAVGGHPSVVYRAAKGDLKTAYGFKWKFIDK